MTRPVIGFAGMTHLGVNHAAAAAEHGFRTVGFDRDTDVISALKQGTPPVTEPGLGDMMQKNAKRLYFTDDAAALRQCGVVFVAPDVPTYGQGISDLSSVHALIELASNAMDLEATLVVLSQVPPGFTRSLGPVARHLYYQVETLIFGEAINRALNPERLIIGCASTEEPLPEAYASFLEAHDCPVLKMRYESAELAKISINCCLVAHVSVANTLADLCEQIGADWSEIVPALRLDRRIGAYAYINAGLGIAGGNLDKRACRPRGLGCNCNRSLHCKFRFPERLGTARPAHRGAVARIFTDHRRPWTGIQTKHSFDEKFRCSCIAQTIAVLRRTRVRPRS